MEAPDDPMLPAGRSSLQVAALLFASSILVLAIFGFVPGITTPYRSLAFAGEESRAQLFGVFQTSVLHNLLHGLVGVAGVAAVVVATTRDGARGFLLAGGIFFVVIALLGVVGALNWLPSDSADNWLHLGLGVSMIAMTLLPGVGRSR
jgi:hypothetical protein